MVTDQQQSRSAREAHIVNLVAFATLSIIKQTPDNKKAGTTCDVIPANSIVILFYSLNVGWPPTTLTAYAIVSGN